MRGAYSTHEKDEKYVAYKFSWENLKERDLLGDLGEDERVILKWIIS
jgi:hypothetical protein